LTGRKSGWAGFSAQPLCFYLRDLADSDFAVAIAAVNRLAVARFKGDLGSLAAIGTNRREHLAGAVVAVAVAVTTAGASGALNLAGGAAGGTALGSVDEAFGRKELLVRDAEDEVRAAIAARKRFLLKTQLDDLLSLILVGVGVIQYSGDLKSSGKC